MTYSLACETCLTQGESLTLADAQRVAREHLADHPGHRIHVSQPDQEGFGITVHDCFVPEDKAGSDGD